LSTVERPLLLFKLILDGLLGTKRGGLGRKVNKDGNDVFLILEAGKGVVNNNRLSDTRESSEERGFLPSKKQL